MIGRYVFIILAAIGVQGCGGGAGSPTAGGDIVQYHSETVVVDGAKVQVTGPLCVVDLGVPNWQGDDAHSSGPTLSYVMTRRPDYFVVAGTENGIGFHGVAGTLSDATGDRPITYEAQIQIISGKTALQHPVLLSVNTNWDVPRVLGGIPSLGVDIYADLNSTGEFTGRVGFRQSWATLQGGLFSADPQLNAEYIAGGFSGDQFYGIITGTKMDEP